MRLPRAKAGRRPFDGFGEGFLNFISKHVEICAFPTGHNLKHAGKLILVQSGILAVQKDNATLEKLRARDVYGDELFFAVGSSPKTAVTLVVEELAVFQVLRAQMTQGGG